MEILRKIKGRLKRRSRIIGLGMAALVLASACYFARGSFWEQAGGEGQKTDSRLVILDAGHGGNDPGKISVDGTQEKDLNLEIAKKLKELWSSRISR